MAMKTQGTQLFGIVPKATDPTKFEVIKVDCVVDGLDTGGGNRSEIDITCLEEEQIRQTMRGLEASTTVNFSLNFDVRTDSHVRLHQLSQATEEIICKWAIGLSDGLRIVPKLNAKGDDFELPNTRTWLTFAGEVADMPVKLDADSVIKTSVSIGRKTKVFLIKKLYTEGRQFTFDRSDISFDDLIVTFDKVSNE